MSKVSDYQSFTDIEHVKARPDMYIGPIKNIKECRWIISKKDEEFEAIQEELELNPGLEQCILELIVNAADHVERCNTLKLDKVTKINIDQTKDYISICNNGPGIPIEIHPNTNLYVPEMIFGHLRTSSNYDDNQKKTWGGKNGIGAKAANIFSKKFIIELQTKGIKYYQEFSEGMNNKTVPKITKTSTKGDYTKIIYYPDFKAFGMTDFESNDTIKLILKRAYDLSAATGKDTTIYYNNEKITIKDFTDYMTLFIGKEKKVVYKTDRWEVGFALCPYDEAVQISFVNAICTDEGGTHVTHVLEPVLNKITEELQSKSKGVIIKKQYIKDNVIIFIKALIENPSFSSQLKRKLETKVTDFGSRCNIPDDIIKKVAKLGICDNVLEIAKAKEMKDAMKKMDGTKSTRLSDIKKLEDANWAGTSKSMECTLILTEGDSVSGDTPLTLKNSKGQIVIMNIEDLTNDFQVENDKEYGKSDYEIWTDKGWTKIKHVMKHKTSKKMFRILTHTGCVDVTEDHSLLDKNAKEISPGSCNIEDELLHSFPLFEENIVEIPENYKELEVKELWKYASKLKIQYYQSIKKDNLITLIENYKKQEIHSFKNEEIELSTDEAWVMGLFFADGSCGIYNKKQDKSLNLTWGISNTDLRLLETAYNSLIKIYGDTFTIYTMKNCTNLKQQYKLCLNGGYKSKHIIDKYRKLFYYKKWKYIDSIILNASTEIRESFFKGFYEGDGQHNLESRMKMDVNGKITAHCIFTLCNSLGYQTSINHNHKKQNIYTIGVSKGTFQKNPLIIKKIIELPYEENEVYDLETENHHFQAGIGQLIVHNSAKGLALNGIPSAGGRNKWGAFPLRGKFLNVRTATATQLVKNEEILAINRILGLKEGITDIKKLRYGKVMIFTDSDSVSGDTPLTLRDTKKQMIIKNIEDLTDNFNEYGDHGDTKEYGASDSDYEIWTDKGWTKIKHVMRHKISKKMYRIVTHTGSVDVTEDHSLLNINGEKIKPSECEIGNELLHCPILFEDNKIEIPDNYRELEVKELWKYASLLKIWRYQAIKKDNLLDILEIYKNSEKYKFSDNNEINVEEAYVMGLVCADGTCGIYDWEYTYQQKNRPQPYTKIRESISWNITNTDIKLLEKSLDIMTKIYGNYFKILELGESKSSFSPENPKKIYRLILNGGNKTKYIVEKYRNLLYYKKYKYIHPSILNSSKEVREQFFKGYYDGDGIHDLSKPMRIDVNSKITAHCIYILSKSLGYEVSINNDIKKPIVYSMSITKGTLQKKTNIIKKIIELPYKEQYVYDLETENHHFNAGIGSIIIHNCDGAHIKGLLINYFTFNWPKLVEQGLLECMITPLIKVFKGNKSLKEFYNVKDYKIWLGNNKETGIREKYYKGLGTSTAVEAKEYFSNLESNRKIYKFNEEIDNETIIKTFDKDYADDRKTWITNYLKNPEEIDYKKKEVDVNYFINRELVQFSVYDNIRSIPNIIDGFKPSQRKILYACIKKNLFLKQNGEGEIKVAQLSGYISEQTSYHHGEVSLQGTIINMSQDFVGSNNLNLLMPIGNFGTRLLGGDDAASPRYIYTVLRKEVKLLFNETDNKLLNYLEDEGQKIEPDFYVPIIPMLLVNGSNGIGTGWSTNIPCFKLEDIVENIMILLNDEDDNIKELTPYYKGFKGTIVKEAENSWKTYGVIEYVDKYTVDVTELPIGMWKQDFKEYLDKLLETDKIKSVTINDDDKNKTANDVCFRIKMKEVVNKTDLSSLMSFFKLEKNISCSNMVAFDENCVIQKYGSAEDILWTFYKYRLNFYQKRKDYYEKTLEDKITEFSDKLRFILLVIEDKIVVFKKSKKEIKEQLTIHKFDNHDILLSMKLHQFTKDEVESFQNEIDVLKKELMFYKSKTNKDIWREDLNELIKVYKNLN